MKTILQGLLVFTWLTISLAGADVLREKDDNYVGFQWSTSFDAKSVSRFKASSEYSYLLVEHKDGLKRGVALTHDRDGNQYLNYLLPPAGLDIGDSRVIDYAIPVMSLGTEGDAGSDSGTGNSGAGNGAVIGLAVLVAVGLKLKSDLESDWQVVE